MSQPSQPLDSTPPREKTSPSGKGCCSQCGIECQCREVCQCTETLCQCAASSVLSSISPRSTKRGTYCSSSKKNSQILQQPPNAIKTITSLSTAEKHISRDQTSSASDTNNLNAPLLDGVGVDDNDEGAEQKVISADSCFSRPPEQDPLAVMESFGPSECRQPAGKAPVVVAEFAVDGMTCTMCSRAIERVVSDIPGVQSVAVSLTTDTAVVEWRPENTLVKDSASVLPQHHQGGNDDENMIERITNAIESIGYQVANVNILAEKNPIALKSFSSSQSPSQSRRGQSDAVPSVTTQVESVEERWQRVRDRQAAKVQARRNAFLFSLAGTLPILTMTMVLGRVLPRTVMARHITLWRHVELQVEALVLWILATPVQFISGFEFYKMSYHGIRTGRAGMDVLVAVGTTASYGYALMGALQGDDHAAHFFETSAVLICFVLAGKWMQALAVRRTSDALTQLMELQSSTAIKVTPFKDRGNFNPLKDPYKEATVNIHEVQTGDMVKVIRGASVPADGRILHGEISVDESMITGESLPVFKSVGSLVLGGTICVETSALDSPLDSTDSHHGIGAAFIEVTGVGKDTALAQIVQLVQEAQTRTVPVQSFADDVSAVFVPTVCAIALVTYMIWYALCSSKVVPEAWYKDLGEDPATFSLMFAIACLVISCPCALGLATPTAIMVGTGVGAKVGILMKGGEALEIASKVNSLVFDKTGTLTKGKPAVSDFIRIKIHDDDGSEGESANDDLLWMLGSLERTSEHPLARAVVVFAEERIAPDYLAENPFVQPVQFRALTGRGAYGTIDGNVVAVGNRSFASFIGMEIPLEAEECMRELEQEGKTAILAAINGRIRSVLGIADELKSDAAASIRYLRDVMHVDVWLVTGDNARTAQAVSRQLGLANNHVIAEALPAYKLQHVSRLQDEGRIVAMVGDGVNDSPALAQADVGMSIGTGAEIAAEASDFVLVKGHVTDVCTALHLSRVIFRRIQWNFVWSMIYNCLGIPIAAGVFYPLFRARLPPTLAALAMALSSVSVVASSLMLRLYRPPRVSEEAYHVSFRSRNRRGGRGSTTPIWQRALRRAMGIQSRSATELSESLEDNSDLTADLLTADQLASTNSGSDMDSTDMTNRIDNRTYRRMEAGGNSSRSDALDVSSVS